MICKQLTLSQLWTSYLVTGTLVTTALRTEYFELQYHLVTDKMFYIYPLPYLQLSNHSGRDVLRLSWFLITLALEFVLVFHQKRPSTFSNDDLDNFIRNFQTHSRHFARGTDNTSRSDRGL